MARHHGLLSRQSLHLGGSPRPGGAIEPRGLLPEPGALPACRLKVAHFTAFDRTGGGGRGRGGGRACQGARVGGKHVERAILGAAELAKPALIPCFTWLGAALQTPGKPWSRLAPLQGRHHGCVAGPTLPISRLSTSRRDAIVTFTDAFQPRGMPCVRPPRRVRCPPRRACCLLPRVLRTARLRPLAKHRSPAVVAGINEHLKRPPRLVGPRRSDVVNVVNHHIFCINPRMAKNASLYFFSPAHKVLKSQPFFLNGRSTCSCFTQSGGKYSRK